MDGENGSHFLQPLFVFSSLLLQSLGQLKCLRCNESNGKEGIRKVCVHILKEGKSHLPTNVLETFLISDTTIFHFGVSAEKMTELMVYSINVSKSCSRDRILSTSEVGGEKGKALRMVNGKTLLYFAETILQGLVGDVYFPFGFVGKHTSVLLRRRNLKEVVEIAVTRRIMEQNILCFYVHGQQTEQKQEKRDVSRTKKGRSNGTGRRRCDPLFFFFSCFPSFLFQRGSERMGALGSCPPLFAFLCARDRR
mmetsp:Transcript_11475/g.30457  ORF Transcript_11475/g.30457 Transcript_11475/m.30457 type:complete len:251 (-) Transcript_11475:1303-2055(-)